MPVRSRSGNTLSGGQADNVEVLAQVLQNLLTDANRAQPFSAKVDRPDGNTKLFLRRVDESSVILQSPRRDQLVMISITLRFGIGFQ